jgi:hypothetical protein
MTSHAGILPWCRPFPGSWLPKPSIRRFHKGENISIRRFSPSGIQISSTVRYRQKKSESFKFSEALNRFRMFLQPVVKHRSRRSVEPKAAFSRSGWDGLPDVNEDILAVVGAISRGQGLVQCEGSLVIDRVDARSDELVGGRQVRSVRFWNVQELFVPEVGPNFNDLCSRTDDTGTRLITACRPSREG